MSEPQRTEILNVRLPEEVLALLDRLVEQGLFNSRSEAVRAFCREYLEEHG
jgi:Arc/MetJ-type ribon-helix-helix transcriptional regulator